MDFSLLTKEDLDNFLAIAHTNNLNFESTNDLDRARDLFNYLFWVEGFIFPYPIVDLYISALYKLSNDVSKYQHYNYNYNDLLNINEEKVGEFASALGFERSQDINLDRQRITRILGYLELITSPFDDLDPFILHEIFKDKSLKEINNFCSASRRLNEALCQSDDFWQVKFINDFSDYQKIIKREPEGNNWEEKYKDVLKKYIEFVKIPDHRAAGYRIEDIENPSEEVQLAAVKQNGYAIRHMGSPSEEIQLAAVQKNGLAIQFIKNPSEEVQLAAVQKNGYAIAIQYIKNPSEEVQLAAIRTNWWAIQYIKTPSEEVQLAAVRTTRYAIKYIKNPSEAVQLAAVQSDADAIEYIKNPSEAVQLAAVQQNGDAIQFIKNPSEAVKQAAGIYN